MKQSTATLSTIGVLCLGAFLGGTGCERERAATAETAWGHAECDEKLGTVLTLEEGIMARASELKHKVACEGMLTEKRLVELERRVAEQDAKIRVIEASCSQDAALKKKR